MSSCLSHHLSPRHGVLLVSGVPVSKVVHVSSRVHWCAFGSHADVPQGARRRGRRRWGGEVVSLRSTGPILHDLFVFGSFVLEPYFHLGLRQAQFGCQVGSLGQGEVLGLLEALVERLELQAGVNGPRLPDLLPLPIQPHLAILYHRCGLLVFRIL